MYDKYLILLSLSNIMTIEADLSNNIIEEEVEEPIIRKKKKKQKKIYIVEESSESEDDHRTDAVLDKVASIREILAKQKFR
jgi:hypothetical protein